MKVFSLLLAGITILIFLLPNPEDKKPQPSTQSINGVTLFDGENWLTHVNVLVESGKISAIGYEHFTADQQVDARGLFMIPGLIDAHVHTFGAALENSLKFGTTTVIDLFMDHRLMQQLQPSRNDNSQFVQADLYSAGILATAPGGHGTEYGISIPTLKSVDDAETFVVQRISEGSDFIKLVYQAHSPIKKRFSSIDLATMQAVINSAHRHNKLAVVHVSDLPSALDAVKAGADGLVHTLMDRPVSEELIKLMVNNHTFVIPTLTVHEAMTRNQANENWLDFQDRRITALMRATLKQRFNSVSMTEHRYQLVFNNTQKMYQAGITLLAGTDAPNPGTAHGISMPIEMRLMQELGMTATEVIQAATINVAKSFKLSDIGQLKAGYKADFILLSEDPRVSLSALQSPSAIFKNGYKVN